MGGRPRALTLTMALLTSGGLLALALWALPWVRDRSGSLLADFAILALWAVLAFGAGWFQVQVVMPGERKSREEDRSGLAAFQTRTVLRSILVGFALLANLVWSDLLAGEFWFSHYARSGVQATALRSSDPETRRWSIARVAESPDPSVEGHVARLASLTRDEDPEVRADAIAALGHLAWRMRTALRVLQRDGVDHGRFEGRVLKAVLAALGDPSERVEGSVGREQRAWIYAAGALGDPSLVPVLHRVCRSADPEAVVAAVHALADIGSAGTLPVLVEVVSGRRGEPAVHAAWALGLVMAAIVAKDPRDAHRVPEYALARDAVREHLAGLEPEAACAFLKWFPEIADASMTGALVDLARSRTFLHRCRRVERARWFGPPEVVTRETSVWEAALSAMASVAVGNGEMRRFLEQAVADSGLPEEVRTRMKGLLDQVTQAQ